MFFEYKHDGRRLDKDSFKKYFLKKLKKNLKIKKDSKVLICLSGGKDSIALLYAIKELFPDLYLIGLYVDEGIEEHSEIMEKRVKKYCEDRVNSMIYKSFKEFFGLSLPEIEERIRRKNKNLSPCTFCTIVKRRIIDHQAMDLGVDLILTGHILDDYVVSSLINLYTGNTKRLFRLWSENELPGLPRKETPLKNFTKEETKFFCEIHNVDVDYDKCPYKIGIRLDIERHLDELEAKYPGLKIITYKTFEKLFYNKSKMSKVKACKICGFPSSGDTCSYCKLKKMVLD